MRKVHVDLARRLPLSLVAILMMLNDGAQARLPFVGSGVSDKNCTARLDESGNCRRVTPHEAGGYCKLL